VKLDEEYTHLVGDRRLLCELVFRTRTTHHLFINLRCILQNGIQNFNIDRRQPSDLEPAYAVQELERHLIVVRGDVPLCPRKCYPQLSNASAGDTCYATHIG